MVGFSHYVYNIVMQCRGIKFKSNKLRVNNITGKEGYQMEIIVTVLRVLIKLIVKSIVNQNMNFENSKGGIIVQGIWVGIILAIVFIVFLEMLRFFRKIINSSREIDELKRKVNNIEQFIKNENK